MTAFSKQGCSKDVYMSFSIDGERVHKKKITQSTKHHVIQNIIRFLQRKSSAKFTSISTDRLQTFMFKSP